MPSELLEVRVATRRLRITAARGKIPASGRSLEALGSLPRITASQARLHHFRLESSEVAVLRACCASRVTRSLVMRSADFGSVETPLLESRRFDSVFAQLRRRTQSRDPRDDLHTSRPRRPTLRRLAGRCGVGDSTAQNLFLNSLLQGVPGFELHRASIDRVDSAADLSFPRRFTVWVCRAIQARQ